MDKRLPEPHETGADRGVYEPTPEEVAQREYARRMDLLQSAPRVVAE